MATDSDRIFLTVETPQPGVRQFTPDDEITIVLNFTQGYGGNRGVLHIGLSPRDDNVFDPDSQYEIDDADHAMTTRIGDGYYTTTWTIKPNTLMPPDVPSYLVRKTFAWVYVYTRQGQGQEETKVCVTAPIILDMFVPDAATYMFIKVGTYPMEEAHEYHTTKSTCPVEIRYKYNSLNQDGSDSNNKLNTYGFKLFDSNHQPFYDTGELYWDTGNTETAIYTFRNLKDNSTYYVRSYIQLIGKYEMECPENGGYIPIYVHYADHPVMSEHLKLTNTPSGVECKLNTTTPYTSFTINRTKAHESEYIYIGEAIGSDSKIIDKYAIPKEDYIYKAIVYNGDLIVATYYNEITYESNCVKISDLYGCYTAVGDITKHPINRNDRGQILEPMDSVFPYHIINGAPNYDMGSVDGIFSDLDDDCKVIMDSDYLAAKADILRAWLNNGRAKLLTYYTGEAWIVGVKGIQTTDPENNDIYHTVFQWTQIGDASLVSEYVRFGLTTSDG